jgi:hypothetical protein
MLLLCAFLIIEQCHGVLETSRRPPVGMAVCPNQGIHESVEFEDMPSPDPKPP